MAEVASASVALMFTAEGSHGQIQKELSGAGKSAGASASKSFGSSFKSGVKGLAAPIAGLFAVSKGIDFLKEANAEARESQKVGALTTSVIKATGGAAKVTAKQVGDLSTALSNKTGIDDETIQSGENMLLTFKNIRNEVGKGNDIFNQSTKTLVDLSAAMGTDPKNAAIQLGKALNDPVKGITALTRVGVTFDDQQKKQIKTLVAQGRTMDAQKIILKELNSEFGGAAAAQATAGDKAAVAMGNLKETVGTALLPILDKLQNVFTNKIAPAVTSFVQGMQSGTGPGGKFADVIGHLKDAFVAVAPVVLSVIGFLASNKESVGAFVGVILAVVSAIKVWTVVQTALDVVLTANPIGLVVVAIAALVAALVYAYKNSETFRAVVQAAFQGIAAAGRWMWNNVLQPVFKALVTGIAWIMDKFGDMLSVMSHVPGFGWAKTAADLMHGAADKAKNLADNISKIHDKTVTVTYNEVTIRSVQNKQANDPRLVGHNALGTNDWRGGPTWVGERGPEILDLPKHSRIIPNHRIGSPIGGHGAGGGTQRVVLDFGSGRVLTGWMQDEVNNSAAYARTTGRHN